jgi:hypothetical protein
VKFNTVYSDLLCPFCDEKVESGVGFQLGAIAGTKYHLGDLLKWDGKHCRPAALPACEVIRSVGYFNCDNIRCKTWSDCYPEVQQALVTVKNGVIAEVVVLHERRSGQNFDIVEPEGLS